LSLIEELKIRNELLNALDARDEVTLLPILKFIIKFIRDPKFNTLLIQLSNTILDIYGEVIGESQKVDKYFRILRNLINEEITLQTELHSLKGVLDTLMLASTIHRNKISS